MASGSLIPRVYSGFRGVDFRGEEINLIRSPDALNMWKDYKKTDSISTRPKLKKIHSISYDKANQGSVNNLHSMAFYKNQMICHIGKFLCKTNLETNSTEIIYPAVGDTESDMFVFNDVLYFKNGGNYKKYNGAGFTAIDVGGGYVPTTLIGRRVSKGGIPGSGGSTHQEFNMLSQYRWNTFIWDGDESVNELHLDSTAAVSVEEFKMFKGGEWVNVSSSAYQFVEDKGIVSLLSTVDTLDGLPIGVECFKIKYAISLTAHSDEESKILGCTISQVFDNRVFFSGNPSHPNMVWHSSLNDPTYVSDLDYYNEGTDSSAVKAMVSSHDVLWVFKEPSQTGTTAFYHRPTIDATYGKIYPNTHSSISTGCVGKAINFNDDIVFFSERGMEGVSGDITSEQFLSHRSSLVDRMLTAEPDYANMILEEWQGYLLVIIGNKIYLADSRAMFQNEMHNEYEWFYWEMPFEVDCAKVYKGTLYLGTVNEDANTYSFYCMDYDAGDISGEQEGNISSYWVTPKDKFGYPQYLKTTNKRGCTVEATGDEISVYAKTEKDDGFTDDTLVGKYNNVTDYFISRIKRKKFKDIQLKFASNKPFTLETATLECFIGGYIKR